VPPTERRPLPVPRRIGRIPAMPAGPEVTHRGPDVPETRPADVPSTRTPGLRRLPEGLTERMAARTRGADASSRGVLDMLAVVGRPLPLADLAALTGLAAERLDPILAGLIAGRAVAEGERAGELIYEIAHPLIRDVVYQQISGARKRTLHRRAARSLLDSGRLAEAALPG